MPSQGVQNKNGHPIQKNPLELEVSTEVAVPLPGSLTSFVGREEEVQRLLELIRRPSVRLLTLTGPGGVGKTRLALRVAESIATGGDTQVTFVELASLDDPDAVPATIGRAFGVPESGGSDELEQLTAALGSRRLLLVLDNFERVVDASPLLIRLLSHCPELTIIATSRVVLHVSGEHEFALRPLELPVGEASLEEIGQSPAVRLFRDRVSATSDSSVDLAAELSEIAEICRRLDGLPLAIELAAARARVFSPADLLERLQGGHSLLSHGPRDAPDRHRSMHGAIAWSYDLLTPAEQRMLRLLSVFSGGFTLTAAESLFMAMTPCELDRQRVAELAPSGSQGCSTPFDVLSSLTEQSLVERYVAAGGQQRFRMLETIREFGQEMLVADGEESVIRNRHAAWFASLVGELMPHRPSLSIVDGSDPLENEHDNLRSAIVWSLARGDAETAGRLARGLDRFWAQQGLNTEARATLGKILGSTGAIRPELRASLLLDAARSAWCQSDFDISGELAAEARSIYEDIGDQSGIAASLPRLGDAALVDSPGIAASLYREAVELQRPLGNVLALESSLHCLGDALVYTGDYAAAKAAYGECLALMEGDLTTRWLFNPLGWVALAEHDLDLAERLSKESLENARLMGIPYPQGVSLRLLGRVHFWRGELDEATACYHQALDLMMPIRAMHEANYCVAELGAVAQAAGDDELAARWLGFEEEQRARQRLGLSPDESEIRTRAHDLARDALGASRFASAWAAGRNLTSPQAFAEARAWKPRQNHPRNGGSLLTRRQMQVLRLLAADKSNHEIASELFIGPRTVETHVASILSKLDVPSRHAAVRVAQSRGLLDQG